MSRSKRFLTLLIALIIIIAAGIGGYALWQNQKVASVPPALVPQATNQDLPENQIPTPSPAEASVPVDWKTYRNEKYRFEVKYPPYLDDFDEYDNKIFIAHSKESASEAHGFNVEVIIGKPSLENYLRKLDSSRTARHVEFDPIKILKKSDIKVGPYPAIQYEAAQYAIPAYGITTYIDLAPYTIVSLGVGRTDKSITESLRQLNNQILFTFKFIPLENE